MFGAHFEGVKWPQIEKLKKINPPHLSKSVMTTWPNLMRVLMMSVVSDLVRGEAFCLTEKFVGQPQKLPGLVSLEGPRMVGTPGDVV